MQLSRLILSVIFKSNQMKDFFFIFAALCTVICSAQSNEADLRSIPLSGTVNVREIDTDFFPSLINYEIPSPGGDSYRDYLTSIKRKMQPSGVGNFQKTPEEEIPIIQESFEVLDLANAGTPNDNDLSISNDGKMIVVINSLIQMWDVSGETQELLGNFSLQAFSSLLGEYALAFDPKTAYDPIADRFVITFLNDYDSFGSRIVMAFSKTNDPMGEWNLYEIPGNPLDNDKWSDYPMICFTQNELFLTMNLLIDEPGISWQLGFHETIIWQIDKISGYLGEDLDTRLHSGVVFYDEKPVRNLIPVKGGSGLKGPNQYFLSNRNFDIANDSIFLIEVTGLLDDPETEVKVDVLVADQDYGVPPFGKQDGDRELDTNDGRILGAFLEDERIHFVSNSYEPNTGLCAIYHGTINNIDSNPSLTAAFISDDTRHLAYPNLSYSGQLSGDDQAIINFLYSGPDDYAGNASVFYNDGNYSPIEVLKDGEYFIGSFGSSYSRWGDYTGSQTKYNEPGVVYTVGSWSRQIGSGSLPLISGKARSWVSALASPFTDFTGISSLKKKEELKLYPNPTVDRFVLQFKMESSSYATIKLYDQRGSIVTILTRHKIKQGLNEFSFDTRDLIKGIYLIKVETEAGVISQKQLIVR